MPHQNTTKPCPDCGHAYSARGERCRKCAQAIRAASARENITPPNPSGLCMCGCGTPTRIAKRTEVAKGWLAGRPICFVTGHQSRTSPLEYVEEDRGYTTPCHIWQRYIEPRGYGQRLHGGRIQRAHIVAWERINGPVPDGYDLDHLCRVRPCINPEHLEPVTRAVNIQRGAKARLNPEVVRQIRAMGGAMSHRKIAAEFGIAHTTVGAVLRGDSWGNVE